jgi:hypothetical protein
MKALMLIHRLFQDGDPSFEREVLQGMRRGARLLNLSDLEMIHTQMLGTIPHLYAHMPCISMSALIALFWGNVNLVTDLIRVRGPGHIVISNLVPPSGYEYSDGRYGGSNGYRYSSNNYESSYGGSRSNGYRSSSGDYDGQQKQDEEKGGNSRPVAVRDMKPGMMLDIACKL